MALSSFVANTTFTKYQERTRATTTTIDAIVYDNPTALQLPTPPGSGPLTIERPGGSPTNTGEQPEDQETMVKTGRSHR